MSEDELKAEVARLAAEIESLKQKMKELPTRRIGDKWYTESEFQARIHAARFWGL